MIDLVGFKIKLFRDLEADASDVELCLLFANHFPVRVLPFFCSRPPPPSADSGQPVACICQRSTGLQSRVQPTRGRANSTFPYRCPLRCGMCFPPRRLHALSR